MAIAIVSATRRLVSSEMVERDHQTTRDTTTMDHSILDSSFEHSRFNQRDAPVSIIPAAWRLVAETSSIQVAGTVMDGNRNLLSFVIQSLQV